MVESLINDLNNAIESGERDQGEKLNRYDNVEKQLIIGKDCLNIESNWFFIELIAFIVRRIVGDMINKIQHNLHQMIK